MRVAAVLPIVLALPCMPAWGSQCTARSSTTALAIVELYTSEGCSSCPPADRWLSNLKDRPDVVALAFHVDYWDRLGWRDRFASPAYTRRQTEVRDRIGGRFVYTPQVLIDGRDRPDWSATRVTSPGGDPPITVDLARDGDRVRAVIRSHAGLPMQLAGYWAVTENDHGSEVKAGENSGVRLRHDFVVRQYQPVATWAVMPGSSMTLLFAVAAASERPPTVNLVIVDATTGRPVQALRLGGCRVDSPRAPRE